MKPKSSLILTLSLGIVASLILAGCGANGPAFKGFEKAKPNKGLIYVYRPLSLGAGAKDYIVVDVQNKKVIGILENGSYLKYDTTPGKKSIAIYEKEYSDNQKALGVATQGLKFLWLAGDISKPRATYSVQAKSNNIVCIKWDAALEGIGNYNGLVDRKTCNEEIVKTRKVTKSK